MQPGAFAMGSGDRRSGRLTRQRYRITWRTVFVSKPGTTTRRNALSEWFVIDNNKIRRIYSAMFYPSSEVPVPNWPPYEGNWPLAPSLAPAPPPAATR